VLIGCPPGERHTFPVLLLSLLLRRRGLEVVYLGADIPIERMEETTASIQPDLVILAAQQLSTAATLQSAARSLQGRGISLAYGGMIFNQVPKLRERIPGFFLGESLEASMNLIERLVVAPAPSPTGIRVDEIYLVLARLYREKRPRVEIALYEEIQKVDLVLENIDEANHFFGNGLSAALALGDPAFIEADLDWVEGLLTGRQIPAERLRLYLEAYSHSLRRELGESSAPITDWIVSYLARNDATQA
jgi:hypothetical protein